MDVDVQLELVLPEGEIFRPKQQSEFIAGHNAPPATLLKTTITAILSTFPCSYASRWVTLGLTHITAARLPLCCPDNHAWSEAKGKAWCKFTWWTAESKSTGSVSTKDNRGLRAFRKEKEKYCRDHRFVLRSSLKDHLKAKHSITSDYKVWMCLQ